MNNVIERPATGKGIIVSIWVFVALVLAIFFLSELIESHNKNNKKGGFEKSMQELDESIRTYRTYQCMPASQGVLFVTIGTTTAPLSCLQTIVNCYSAVAWTIEGFQ